MKKKILTENLSVSKNMLFYIGEDTKKFNIFCINCIKFIRRWMLKLLREVTVCQMYH